MAPSSNIIAFGGTFFGAGTFPELQTPEDVQKLLDLLKSKGCTKIDTAQLYGMGKSEEIIGQAKAIVQGFAIDTKWLGGWLGKPWATRETMVSSAKESLVKLGAGKGKEVDIFYIHSRDLQTSFEETLKGVNEAYQPVKEVLEICKKNNYIMPSVYQGSYAAVARKAEDELFPLLRENNFSFYAYSPIAGGFLTKNRKFVEEQQGRFNKDARDGIYHKMYTKENFMSLLDDWEKIANEEGVSKAELAFRWINYHSALDPAKGDGVIFGASKFAQVEATLQYLKNGPLKDSSAKQINALWDKVKNDSILDNFQAVFGGSA
ncbi:hypothetical protein LTR70_002625 [Exophiala xenobiotica]|uniref:NADP-dependent oxidoreductase domain-containing protein n=1 Tax=Lithohypha guttulata TaxID=1690604 RepID=A0ABR0KJB9_9EURO|nr:hypothetical protein LTR24_002198 [Lithohypha guttulata]KAK5325245.1 hypothetical protein LTR70_002625 [Exophiala xenobiotica]